MLLHTFGGKETSSAVDGSARRRRERIRPATLAGLVADLLREFGRLVRRVAPIDDTRDILLGGATSCLKLGRQLAEK